MSKPKRIETPLEALSRDWMASAKWYRGEGFTFRDAYNSDLREANATTYEICARELRRVIRAAKRKPNP